jgi:ABC-type glycerol-3-phosphate transport system permease component
MSDVFYTVVFTVVSIVVLIICAYYGEKTRHKIKNNEL